LVLKSHKHWAENSEIWIQLSDWDAKMGRQTLGIGLPCPQGSHG
jgi:hypothetical protein